jgi:hypothetical protein
VSGLAPSRHGWMNSVPDRERIEAVHAFYGLDRLRF